MKPVCLHPPIFRGDAGCVENVVKKVYALISRLLRTVDVSTGKAVHQSSAPLAACCHHAFASFILVLLLDSFRSFLLMASMVSFSALLVSCRVLSIFPDNLHRLPRVHNSVRVPRLPCPWQQGAYGAEDGDVLGPSESL